MIAEDIAIIPHQITTTCLLQHLPRIMDLRQTMDTNTTHRQTTTTCLRPQSMGHLPVILSTDLRHLHFISQLRLFPIRTTLPSWINWNPRSACTRLEKYYWNSWYSRRLLSLLALFSCFWLCPSWRISSRTIWCPCPAPGKVMEWKVNLSKQIRVSWLSTVYT